MLAVLQRVSEARVIVNGETIGEIGAGLLALVCAERGDTPTEADKLLAKMLKLRIFADEAGKMNRSVQDVDGGLLVVSHSRWPPTPPAATGRASPTPPTRRPGGRSTSTSSPAPAPPTRRCRPAASPPT